MTPELIEKTEQLHDSAMSFVDEAIIARRRKDAILASQLMQEALVKEIEAAELVEPYNDFEPTRGILFRSAASIAMECGELRTAEKLICKGLSGEPPEYLMKELRELYEQVNLSEQSS